MSLSKEEYEKWKGRVPAIIWWMEQNNIPLSEIEEHYSDAMIEGIQESHKYFLNSKERGDNNGS